MQTYQEKIELAQAQINGAEHDPAAKWARTMYAARVGLGWTHEYCHDGRIDMFLSPEGHFLQVERRDMALQERVYQLVKAELASITESLAVAKNLKLFD